MSEPKTKKAEKAEKTAPVEETALTTQGTMEIGGADDWSDEAGAGFEENDASLVKIPFLSLLQPSSRLIKQPKKQRPPKLAEAEAGMLINTVTGEMYDIADPEKGGLEVVPVYYRKVYVLQAPEMGGYKGKLQPNDPRVKKALSEGDFGNYHVGENEMVETIELYVVYKSPYDGQVRAAVVNIQSTKIPVFKEWNTNVSGFQLQGPKGPYTPAIYANRTVIRSEYDPSKGEDKAFYRIILEPAVKDAKGNPDFKLSLLSKSSPLAEFARKFHADLLEMKVDADYSTSEDGTGGGGGGGGGRPDKRADAGF